MEMGQGIPARPRRLVFSPQQVQQTLGLPTRWPSSLLCWRWGAAQSYTGARRHNNSFPSSRIIVDRPRAAGRYGGASGNQPEATGGAGVGGKPLFAPAAASTWLERLMATYERRIWVGVLASTPVERFPSFENLDHHCNPAKALTHPSQHFCARR